jgi:hypothetical protein
MTQTSIIGGATPPPNPNSYNPINRARDVANTPIAVKPGTPMAANLDDADGSVVLCSAAAASSQLAIMGLASSAAAYGKPCHTQYSGPLTLTIEQWDSLLGGSGGLRTGTRYYVSDTAGTLGARPIGSGKRVIPVGIAVSPTTMMIQLLGEIATL